MVNEELRKTIAEISDQALLFDNPSFDDSIIGISAEGCVVYSYAKMIQELAKDDNISEEEAMEFIDTIRALPWVKGGIAPIVVEYSIDELLN